MRATRVSLRSWEFSTSAGKWQATAPLAPSSPAGVSASLDEHGKPPLQHLADLGILGPGLTLVHMIHLDDREPDLTIESGTRVVHCPTASVRRGMGALRMGRFPEMVLAGSTVPSGPTE